MQWTREGFDLTLSADVSRKSRQLLCDYRAEADVDFVALIDEGGGILVTSGALPQDNDAEIAALAAGAFAATREMSQRVGETQFEGLYHQGKHTEFYLCPVHDEILLLSVFDRERNTGLVRYFAAKAVEKLRLEN